MNWLCVIPSVRTVTLEYLEHLGDTPIVIIDDSDGNIPKTGWPSNVRVLDYADRKALLGASDDLVPRKSPSCKGVGLFLAWTEQFDGAILLDDDCDLRVTPDYLERIPVGKTVVATKGSSGEWLNTLALLSDNEFYARGFPYDLRHEPLQPLTDIEAPCDSKFNQGMWSGTPDINGIDKIRNDHVLGLSESHPVTMNRTCYDTALLRPRQFLPCSIMNVQIARELIPAFYQPPDYRLDNGWWIRRHDDVWSAMFLKMLMDVNAHAMTVGQPICWHRKAGDERREAVAEHVTNLIQPYLERVLRSAALSVADPGGYASMAVTLARSLAETTVDAPKGYRPVLQDYAARCDQWARLFL